MAFRMADPAGSRRLARSDAGLYQGPRRQADRISFARVAEISCRSPAFGASLSCRCSSRPLLAVRRAGAGRRQHGQCGIVAEQRQRHRRPRPAGRRAREAGSQRAMPRTTHGWSRSASSSKSSARELLTSAVAFRPRLSEINARLEQLGPAPPEGQPPNPTSSPAERQALDRRKGRDQCRARPGRIAVHPRQRR